MDFESERLFPALLAAAIWGVVTLSSLLVIPGSRLSPSAPSRHLCGVKNLIWVRTDPRHKECCHTGLGFLTSGLNSPDLGKKSLQIN